MGEGVLAPIKWQNKGIKVFRSEDIPAGRKRLFNSLLSSNRNDHFIDFDCRLS